MKGFISYAHEDHMALKAVQKHMAPFKHLFGLKFWADKRINGGEFWSEKIAKAIDEASIHLLLASPAFFQSDFIFDYEIPAIQKKFEQGDLVIPIIVSRCCWEAFLGPLQAVPTDATQRLLPVRDWSPQDNGFDASRAQVQAAIEAHFKSKPTGLDWKRA